MRRWLLGGLMNGSPDGTYRWFNFDGSPHSERHYNG